MRRYWTADLHLMHEGTIGYCNRPFRDKDHMDTWLIDAINSRVKPEDMLFHVGDLAMGSKRLVREMLARINGTVITVQGNHDKNNGVKTVGDWFFTDVGPHRVFVCHVPYYYDTPERSVKRVLPKELVDFVERTCDFSVCGHVHDSWGISHYGAIPTINVGVDVRGYRPLSDDELIALYRRDRKEWQ